MKKGIFWCYILCPAGDKQENKLLTVMVDCDISGKTLENVEFSSKSRENFNHKSEWEKQYIKINGNKPFDYYPRGRVEIKNGKIRIFANPVIIADEEAKTLIIKTFELEENKNDIAWISDNTKHYRYAEDTVSCM